MRTILKVFLALIISLILTISISACSSGSGSSVNDNSGGGSGSEEGESTYYRDADGDGFGDLNDLMTAVSQPEGYVTDSSDCDDTDKSINPDAEEIPDDGKDNDCDGLYANTYYADSDGDGTGDPGVSIVDTSQPEGYVLNNNDCNDTDSDINSDITEICGDGKDNDCDGEVDEFCYIKVPEDFSSIQKAINAASNGCEISVYDGTYNENINFIGKAITVHSVNGAEKTNIDGNAKGTVVTFNSGEGKDSLLDGFTIINGYAEKGGGIYIEG